MIYLKKYETSVPNARRTLGKKIEIASLLSKIQDPGLWLKCSTFENYQKLNFWDLGITASDHINISDTIYIQTLKKIYIGKVLTHIRDSSGVLGDLLDWARNHNAPWINVISFKRVSQLPISPEREAAVKKALLSAQDLGHHFYRLNKKISFS